MIKEEKTNIEIKKNKKSVLVTGGSGFIASHLVDRLIKNGYFVVNIDKLDYCSYDNIKNISNCYKFIHGNIANKELIAFILNEYSIENIFHLAAQTHVDNSFYNSIQFTYDNIVGTHNLLECVREYNKLQSDKKSDKLISRFIHMSTDEVYGEVKSGEPECTEKSLLKPTNPYSATKASAELLASSYYHSFQLPIIIIRCNNVFGPRQYPEKVIPAFIYNILNGDKCYIHGKGSTERHFIYVENVIDAILTIYDKGNINEIYNIANTECYKVIELAKLIIKKLNNTDNFQDHIEYIQDRNFNDFRYLINSEKLEKLGWTPKINFEEGLKRTIQSFKNTIKK
jgi:dTDP-glucose 4,6-dehydratase